jgi:hypothetical protein
MWRIAVIFRVDRDLNEGGYLGEHALLLGFRVLALVAVASKREASLVPRKATAPNVLAAETLFAQLLG